MTRTETDDKQMKENLKDQLDVLLWLNQEFDDYNMQYFNKNFQQTLQAIGKCKRLQERLTVERRLCYSDSISLLLKENNVMNIKFIY